MNLYYFSNLQEGVTLHLADYLGIDPLLRTSDLARALNHSGTLYIIDSWNQPPKFDLVLARQSQHLATELIYDYSYESGPGTTFVVPYLQAAGDIAVHWLINRSVAEQFSSLPHTAIDYFAVSAVYRLVQGEITPSTQLIKHRPPRVNCLVSKLESRPTRLYALWYLWQQGLADDAVLGILATPEGLSRWHSSSERFNHPEFWSWIVSRLGAADSVNLTLTAGGYLCQGYPFDPEIYNSTRVSVVCETTSREWGTPSSFITEKTYRPLINRSPCVWIAGRSTLAYLKSLGFDVFDQGLQDPDYTRPGPEPYSYVHRAVLAAEQLLCEDPEQLQQAVDHNYQQLLSLALSDRNRARQVLGLESDLQWLDTARTN